MVLQDNKFKLSIYCSIFLHAIFLVMLYLGTPSFYKEYKQDHQLVSFEMLPASAVMNLPPMTNPEIKKIKDKAKAKPDRKPQTTSEKQNQKTKTEPKVETKKTVATNANNSNTDNLKTKNNKSSVKAEDLNKTKLKKEPIKQQDEPKDKANKDVKKTKTSTPSKNLRKSLEDPAAAQASPFDVLDDKEKKPKKAKQKKEVEITEEMIDERNFSTSQLYDEFNPLSITETMLIRRQIEKHWSPPVGLDSAGGVQILITLTLSKNAHIKKLKVKNVICPKRNIAVCRLVAESALRAVKKASPIKNLSPDRYDIWGEFDLLFDPEDLL